MSFILIKAPFKLISVVHNSIGENLKKLHWASQNLTTWNKIQLLGVFEDKKIFLWPEDQTITIRSDDQ